MWKPVALVACVLLASCGGKAAAPERISTPPDWRTVATDADRARLRSWRDAWVAALGRVRAAGQGAQLAPEGALFDPDRALPGALPAAGDYRCRVFKLGAKGTAAAEFRTYPWFDCRIDSEGEVLSLYKDSGAQRPVGLIFRDGDARAIFLGTMMLGDERSPLQYGQDATRDMAGVVERIGERHWRVALPYPAFESVLDVIELVPAK
jgi:hypothetical protein